MCPNIRFCTGIGLLNGVSLRYAGGTPAGGSDEPSGLRLGSPQNGSPRVCRQLTRGGPFALSATLALLLRMECQPGSRPGSP